MRVLVTGANGFLGQKIVAALLAANHAVTACVRKIEDIERRFPDVEVIYSDFNHDLLPEVWLPRLNHIDVVINCVGILQGNQDQSIQAVHTLAPIALFKACIPAGIKKVIQISAYEAEADAVTDYGRSKHSADNFLKSLNIDWVILKPSLFYSNGSYGGTSLFRATASLPLILPLPEGGNQKMQPLLLGDFATALVKLMESEKIKQQEYNVVGPEEFTLKEILLQLRHWLGFGKVKMITIPSFFVELSAKIADFFSQGPFCTNSVKMLQATKPIQNMDFWNACQYQPLTMKQALQFNPSNVQDRWHARLYFLSPLLRISICAMWFFSSTFWIAQASWTAKFDVLIAIWALFLAALMLKKRFITLAGSLQILTILIMLVFNSIYHLELNTIFQQVTIILATLAMMIMSDER